MRWTGIAVASCVLLVGCSPQPAATPSPATFDVTGTMTISRVMLEASDGDSCTGIEGYDDIKTGAQVKVSDDAGKIIGLGALKAGLARDTNESWRGTNLCVFDFQVKGIPEGPGMIYGVEVSHRGVVQFTRDQADSIALKLG